MPLALFLLLSLLLGIWAFFSWYANRWERSVQQSLAGMYFYGVYAEGKPGAALRNFMQHRDRATSQAVMVQQLEKALYLTGDKHGWVIAPGTSADEAAGYRNSEGIEWSLDSKFVLGHLIDAHPSTAEFRVGDELLSIDGIPVEQFAGQQLLPAPEHLYWLRRNGQSFSVRLPAEAFQVQRQDVKPQVYSLNSKTAYVLLTGSMFRRNERTQQEQQYVQQYVKLFSALPRPLCGVVLDLRVNKGGYLSPQLKVASLLLGKGHYFGELERSTVDRAGQHVWNGVDQNGVVYLGQGGPFMERVSFDVNSSADHSADQPWVAVLTGELTSSAGEAVTLAALTHPRARVIGTATGGFTTSLANTPLGNNGELLYSIAWMTDTKKRVQKQALEPHEMVETPASQFRTATDPALKRAQEWLTEQGCTP